MLNFLVNIFEEKATLKSTCGNYGGTDVIQSCTGCVDSCQFSCQAMCKDNNSGGTGAGGCGSNCTGTCFSLASMLGTK